MKKYLFIAAAVTALLIGATANAQTQINQALWNSGAGSITKSGSYILTSNITATTSIYGFNISASNVTLNLNGFTITGAASCSMSGCTALNNSYYGVYVQSGYTGITIENGSIANFYYGVYAANSNIHDLGISNCQAAIWANYSIIRHNVISNCDGWTIYDTGGTISDNALTNITYGIAGTDSSITNNTVVGAQQYGMSAFNSFVSGNTLVGNATDLSLGNNSVSNKNNACTAGAC